MGEKHRGGVDVGKRVSKKKDKYNPLGGDGRYIGVPLFFGSGSQRTFCMRTSELCFSMFQLLPLFSRYVIYPPDFYTAKKARIRSYTRLSAG